MNKLESKRVFIITGAPRSGTHLLNNILCGSSEFMPLLTETSYLVHLLHLRDTMRYSLSLYPDNYFSNEEEIDSLSARHLDDFVDHLFDKYDSKYVVLRAPILATKMEQIFRLTELSKYSFSFIYTIRDPRDVLVSLMEWDRKARENNGKPLADDMVEYAIVTYRKSYNWLVENRNIGNVHSYRYEDIVSKFDSFTQQITADIGLNDNMLGKDEFWGNKRANLSADDPNMGVCITDLYNKPISDSSVGRYLNTLSSLDLKTINKMLKKYIQQFNYSL